MSNPLHFCPLEEALENSPFEFAFIKNHVYMAMFHRDGNMRIHAELKLNENFGRILTRAFCLGNNVYIEVSDGNEKRDVLLGETPQKYGPDYELSLDF